MKKTILKKILTLAMVLAAVVMMAGYSMAADITVNLAAVQATWTPPGGGTIPMWGFVEDTANSCDGPFPDWDVGPQISAVAGDNLTINLRNCLSEEVSVFIPGQSKLTTPVAVPADSQRIRSFDAETAPEEVVSYTWNNLKAGTYIYHSGTNLSKQVHMGLYGALIVNAGAGIAYNGASPVTYDNEVMLFFSEIDPALHDPPAAAYPSNYKPRYFLVNGQSYPNATPILDHSLGTNERVLVRMISAALDDLVPTINGLHWDIVAEDGNPYLYPKKQVTALVSPMKTRDAILVADMEGTYPVFDRRFHLTNASSAPGGMMVMLDVAAVEGIPVITIISPANGSSFVEGTSITFTGTATDADNNDLSDQLIWTSNRDGNIGSGASFEKSDLSLGVHTITASATDTDNGNTGSRSITVTITSANNPPTVTINSPGDQEEFYEGDPISFSGVANDDEDGDLSASLSWSSNIDGAIGTGASFENDQLSPGIHTITASVTDSGGLIGSASISIVVVNVNNPPVANNDFATTTRITGNTITTVTIHVTANDTDPDGNLDPTTVFVTNEEFTAEGWVAISTRGGKVTNLKTGYVIYEPRRGFQGTDTFTYNVRDTEGLVSNQATVQVNVVK